MAQPLIQASFNSGEWAPQLYGRVDVEKYHSGAALLRNFFVDYRGGVSTRSGTKYVLQAYKSSTAVRLIPFQASFTIGYMLEFGDGYIRFHNNGAPVLETGLNVTGVLLQSNCAVVFTNTGAKPIAVGDWVYISGIVGTTQLNNKYYIVNFADSTGMRISDLFGNQVNATGFSPWISGGTVQRVYTLPSPYVAADLALLKYAQNVTALILCHPNYPPFVLTNISATNWTLTAIAFGSTMAAPTGLTTASTLAADFWNYSYVVTAVDSNGHEGPISSPGILSNLQFIGSSDGYNQLSWNAVAGAVSYNVYKATPIFGTAVPSGAPYGFIGNTQATGFIESFPGIAADFTQGPPQIRNPFFGAGVASLTLTANAVYTSVPTVSISAPSGGLTATGHVSLGAFSVSIASAGNGYSPGSRTINLGNGVLLLCTSPGGFIATASIISSGSIIAGSVPANPIPDPHPDNPPTPATFNLTWEIGALILDSPGFGYTSTPTVTISFGGATATATLLPASAGNPSVPAFFQQRLVLAAPTVSPQTMYFSQPGDYYNFNVSFPIQPDDAITASIVSGALNNIKSMIPQPAGLITITDNSAWLINGGSFGSAVTPSSIIANAQSFIGANDMPPIISNYDILTVQSKGSSVRDSSYNFYANVYTGSDISVLASHLFFGFQLLEWAWAEEPYKVVWAVRNDGILLTLTFLKEQDFIGWAHSDTAGSFKSVATVIEPVSQGHANAVYTVVERTINSQTVKYIETFPERLFPNGATDAWCVDAGIQYSGPPATSFSGGDHLVGLTCTGLADGVVIPPFVMPANGSFTLSTPASKVTVGLGFTAQLQTLPIDVGNPTIQSKMKKINAGTLRVSQTLGLEIGTSFSNLVPMKDLVVGNVGSMTNAVVTDLVTGDARTFLDPLWQEIGQYCVQQSLPLPATILSVIPQLSVGDSK